MYQIRTSTNNKRVASILARKLVESHAAVSVHVREVFSVYALMGNTKETYEYEVEALTSSTEKTVDVINKVHPFDTPEIIITKMSASEDIKKWCKDWCNLEP